MNDLIDIVNENDEIIGTGNIVEAHEKNLLHRSAIMLCFKDSTYKELLLTRRGVNLYKPNLLCFPGGHTNPGESYEKCARREFVEEVAININPDQIKAEMMIKIRKETDDDPEFLTIFRTVFDGPFKPDPYEVTDYFFEDIKTLEEKIAENPEEYVETAKHVFMTYLDSLKEPVNV